MSELRRVHVIYTRKSATDQQFAMIGRSGDRCVAGAAAMPRLIGVHRCRRLSPTVGLLVCQTTRCPNEVSLEIVSSALRSFYLPINEQAQLATHEKALISRSTKYQLTVHFPAFMCVKYNCKTLSQKCHYFLSL